MPDSNQYRGSNSNRLLSPEIWADFPRQQIKDGSVDGFFLFDDFHIAGSAENSTAFAWNGPQGLLYTGFGTSGVLMNQGDAAGERFGALKFTCDADDEQAYAGPIGGTYQGILAEISDTTGDTHETIFETRVKFGDVTSGSAAVAKMVGLAKASDVANNTIGADGATNDADGFVGFRALAADADGMDAVHMDTNEVVVIEAANNSNLVITADTYAKFGIRFDGVKVYYYVNGVCINPDAGVLPAATDFPDAVALAPFFGMRQHGSAATPTMTIDWWALGIKQAE